MFYVNAVTVPGEKTKELLPRHMEYLNRLADEGVFLIFGPNAQPAGSGSIIAKAENEEELKRYLAQDPFAAARLVKYSWVQFRAARVVPGISAEV